MKRQMMMIWFCVIALASVAPVQAENKKSGEKRYVIIHADDAEVSITVAYAGAGSTLWARDINRVSTRVARIGGEVGIVGDAQRVAVECVDMVVEITGIEAHAPIQGRIPPSARSGSHRPAVTMCSTSAEATSTRSRCIRRKSWV